MTETHSVPSSSLKLSIYWSVLFINQSTFSDSSRGWTRQQKSLHLSLSKHTLSLFNLSHSHPVCCFLMLSLPSLLIPALLPPFHRLPYADPMVCGIGLLASVPLILGAMILAEWNTVGSYIVVFFGQVFLNLNWAVVSDIVLVSLCVCVCMCFCGSISKFGVDCKHSSKVKLKPYILQSELFCHFLGRWIWRKIHQNDVNTMNSHVLKMLSISQNHRLLSWHT